MENVSLSIINLRSRRESAIAANQTWLNIKPDFQREYESWTDKLKTRLIESIIIGRAMNPIWTVRNDTDESEEVLDGMHRLTTALKFIENDFAMSSYLTTLPVDKYKDKRFNDLTTEDKQKIRSYNFIINKLDASYKNDPEKLQDMYEILNRSSKTLNMFEFSKPIMQPFYELISITSKKFLNTVLFESDTSSRGKLETEITKVLALCEERLPVSFASINDIYIKWQHEFLGQTPTTINACISSKGAKYIDTLDRVKKVMDKYTEDSLFPEDRMERRKCQIPIIIIITRTVALVKSNAIFSRHAEKLIQAFKLQIIDGDIQHKLECPSRNAAFQKKLIELVDKIIRAEIGEIEEPRFFSKQMILEKLEEQNNICAICSQKINSIQKYEGDHIQSWICGGRTIKENLQVVHHKCHKRK